MNLAALLFATSVIAVSQVTAVSFNPKVGTSKKVFQYEDGTYWISAKQIRDLAMTMKVNNLSIGLNSTSLFNLMHNMYVFLTSMDWFSARNLCLSENAHLVALETKEEYDVVKENINLELSMMVWIDGVDTFQPRDFYWDSTGLAFNETFANWGVGEPNDMNGQEHCVSLARWLDYGFNDHPCDGMANFICEWHPCVATQ